MTEGGAHLPVLLDDVLELLEPAEGETYADGTAGLGGHAAVVAERLGPGGRVDLCDLDPSNLARATEAVSAVLGPDRVTAHHAGFADLPGLLESAGRSVDGFLADLGFASNQVDDPRRGLSFQSDGPLDMRLDPDGPVTAAELVNQTAEEELANIIYRFGEERFSRRVAKRIVEARAREPINTTSALADIVRGAVPRGRPPRGKRPIDPATRTFQALRIAVNDELGSLESLLREIGRGARAASAGAESWLRPGARVGIISFHSLEDRMVKHAFADFAAEGVAARVTRKPVVAGESETRSNPRSRSAKFRVVRVGGIV